MKYTYVLLREAWLTVEVEADSEEQADEIVYGIDSDGELNDRWRDEVLERDTEFVEVWEGGIGKGLRIYNID